MALCAGVPVAALVGGDSQWPALQIWPGAQFTLAWQAAPAAGTGSQRWVGSEQKSAQSGFVASSPRTAR
jgi:hypothetical protein